MLTLWAKLSRVQRLVVVGLILVPLTFYVMRAIERRAGAEDQGARIAAANAIRQHRAFLRAREASDSVERVALAARAAARITARRLEVATRATDSIVAAMIARRDSAIALANDSSATPAALRLEIRRLVLSETSLLSMLAAERLAYAADTLKRNAALAEDAATIAAKNRALEEAARLHEADELEKAAIRRQRPGFIRRGLGGVVAAVAGAGCGAGGYVLAGPLGGVGGAAVCSAISGALFP